MKFFLLFVPWWLSSYAERAFPQNPSGGIQWIDTHAHLDGKMGTTIDFEGSAEAAISAMDSMGIKKCLVMPPPQPHGFRNLYECDLFVPALKKYRGRIAFLGGGGSLNAMIHQAVNPNDVTADLKASFEKKAGEILALGASGFGEMTALHLSHFSNHPFESTEPDHPLFLLLADIAARKNVPIDFHMDAVAKDMPLPERFTSPPNPATLKANLPAFERLLKHNPKARIVWVHGGSDFIGHWTAALSKELLQKNPNLLISIRINPPGLAETSLFTSNRELKAEWLELIKAFPDRFMLGSDTFYPSPRVQSPMRRAPTQMMLMPLRMLLTKLPEELARKVGYENAARLYRLKD